MLAIFMLFAGWSGVKNKICSDFDSRFPAWKQFENQKLLINIILNFFRFFFAVKYETQKLSFLFSLLKLPLELNGSNNKQISAVYIMKWWLRRDEAHKNYTNCRPSEHQIVNDRKLDLDLSSLPEFWFMRN